MTRKTGAYVLVTRVWPGPAHVPNARVHNTGKISESAFGTPKTSSGKICSLQHQGILAKVRPRSSGDRAPPSGGGCAGSNPAGGTTFF